VKHVKFHLNRFLRRVRIHGGEFDTSARAMYREGVTSSLRAELRIVRGSTIERKQMSTKTTFKRIALVAVASLGLGVLASTPSSAAPSAAYGTLIGDSTAGQQEVNGLATMTITANETITTVSTSGVGSIVSAVVASGDATVSTISGGTFSINDADAATDTSTVTITLTSAAAGTQTITMTPYTSSGSLGTAVTKTLTWVTALTKNTYDHSYAYISGETASAASTNLTADTTTAASASTALHNYDATLSTTVSRARIWVKQFATGDTSTVSNLAAGKGKEVIVEITGAGSLGSAANSATGSVITTAAASTGGGNGTEYWVFSDGRTGTGVVTVKVGGVLVATKTVTFYGASASYAVATATGSALSKLYLGVGETASVKFSGLDASGKVSSLVPTVAYGISDTPTVATVAVATNVVTITGVKVGKTTVYAADAAAKADATLISAGVSVEVTAKTATTVKMSFDKASYAPGEKMTLTVSAVDVNGRPVADGARALFAASATANILPNGTLPAASVDLVSGSATYTLYAPASAGDLTITATEGTATDSTTKGTITATAAVVNPGVDAASAAAEEATAAANDATDAALSAAEAAEAATAMAQEAVDAVAELSASVTKLISALRAQITTLTNLVVKIQKKVKA